MLSCNTDSKIAAVGEAEASPTPTPEGERCWLIGSRHGDELHPRGEPHLQAPLSRIEVLRWSWKMPVENPMMPAHELELSLSTPSYLRIFDT